MPFPILAAIKAGSAVAGLLGRKKPYNYKPRQFSYSPNEADPELLLRRKRALLDIQRGQADTTNEIARAGLLGSGKSFDILQSQSVADRGQLEDITSDTFMKRRLEALDLFKGEEDYNQRKSLLSDQAGYNENSQILGGLSDIGKGFGMDLEKYLRELALKRKALFGTMSNSGMNVDYSGEGN